MLLLLALVYCYGKSCESSEGEELLAEQQQTVVQYQ
jgi:hypothetical protein